MFRIIKSWHPDRFSPHLTIIGKISLEAMQDMKLMIGMSEDDVKALIAQELFDAIDDRDKDMDLENIDIEKRWTEYKNQLCHPLFEPELVKIFEEMGLITTETDMGGNYISLTQKGRDTK